MSLIAVYPGSFDPTTYGHLDIIARASRFVDRLFVAVLNNSAKNPLFTVEERIAQLKEMTADLPNVEIDSFSGLLVDYAHSQSAKIIIRGLRAVTDFEYEFQMALTNRSMAQDIETLFISTSTQHLYLSSSIVKEVARFGGNIDEMVPPLVRESLHRKMRELLV